MKQSSLTSLRNSFRVIGSALCMALTTVVMCQRPKASDFNFYGIEHNRQLDFAYNILLSRPTKNDFVNAVASNIASTYATYPNVQEGVLKFRMAFNPPYCTGQPFYTSAEGAKMSTGARLYADKVSTIVNSPTNSAPMIIAKLSALEALIAADKTLTNSDIYILYSATAVGRYSADYWNTNMQKWIALNTSGNSPEGMNQYVAADCAGAAQAMIEDLWENVIPVEGQVSYTMSVIGEGLGTSACLAIVNWLR